MKKIGLGISIFLFALAGSYFVFINHQQHPQSQNQTQSVTEQTNPAVSVEIFDGTRVATYSANAKTAYSALVEVTTKEQIPLVSKQYDFGVFVSSIGGKPSGTDLAWIYFVNGNSATVGADVYELKTGDTVAWKYIKPLF